MACSCASVAAATRLCVSHTALAWHLSRASGFGARSKWSAAFNNTVYCLHRFGLRYERTHTQQTRIHAHTHTHLHFLQRRFCCSSRACYYRYSIASTSLTTTDKRTLQTHKNETVVVSGSPSKARRSSPPWLYTGTPSTWRRQSYQSWWCRRLGPPIPFYILFHCTYTVGHWFRLAHTVPAFPLRRCLGRKNKWENKKENEITLSCNFTEKIFFVEAVIPAEFKYQIFSFPYFFGHLLYGFW